MSTWIRRRLSYCEAFTNVFQFEFEPCASDDNTVTLRGYRARREEHPLTKDSPDYENGCEMSASIMQRSISPDTSSIGDISNGSTIRDTTPCPDYDRDTTPAPVTYTPVLRRKHSRASHLRRNYRIIAPDESLLILQQHSASTEMHKKNRLLRRKSSKKENEILPKPMVITPPVLLNRTQSCSMCSRELSHPSSDEPMSPTAITTPNRLPNDEEAIRLSLISSSTGYSSARSSLRSSDGSDEANHRDSGVGSCVLSTLSSARNTTINGSAITQLDRIAIELLDTERTYVNDLNDVIQGYLNFLVDRREELQVTLDDVSSLFGCIERIFLFNSRLYQQLDRAHLDCIKIATCFIENAGRFEDYVAYCTNYHKMLGTLTVLQQQPGVAAVLTERQQILGHALPLSSYLLKPVQRILKYHLFIENIMKNLSPDTTNEEKAIVRKAYDVMTAQAGKINEEKKRVEHAERVQQLQNALYKWKVDKTNNLMAYGDLLLEAQFKQAGSKTIRTLFLFEEMLLIVKQRNGSYSCKDYILCSNLMLNESIIEEEPLAFQVVSFDNPRNTYIFLANSTEQKRVWMTELKRMMLDHYAVEIPEKTKQLMLSMDNTQKIAFGRPEFAEVSIKNHKKVPKYLEKRRKSVDQESRRRSLSASRLLASSKSSIASELSIISPTIPKYKLFGVEDDQPRCTCHLIPGPSEDKDVRNSVSRTLSASTIDFGVLTLPPQKPPTDVQTSRSRFHQARNRKHLPPKHEKSLPPRSENVDAHFDALYNQLVSVGADEEKRDGHATMVWRVDTVLPSGRTNRSKSLTRLDDQIIEDFKNVEGRYTKLEPIKKAGKRNTYDESKMTNSNLPPAWRGYVEEKPRPLSARQRAPLSADQIAELDMLLPSVGVVKSRIRQLEANK